LLREIKKITNTPFKKKRIVQIQEPPLELIASVLEVTNGLLLFLYIY